MDGLIFDWRAPRTSRFAKLGIFAVGVGVLWVPLSLIHVIMGEAPVQESQGASVMMLTPSHDPMQWLEMARDHGPFPTRFDPADSQFSRAVADDAMDGVRNRMLFLNPPGYQDLPTDQMIPPVPLVAKGARVLPSVAAPEFKPREAGGMRPVPVLSPLSVQAGELPQSSPPFDVDVTAEMAFQPWRFLLQVSPNGTVRHAVALIGQNTPGRTDLVAWLQAHRFPQHEESGDRWVAVAVSFQNRLSDGADDL